MASITSADAVFTLGVASIFPVAQTLQGYAVDDAFSVESVNNAEVRQGVDGKVSAGWIPYMTPMVIHLMPDSLSIDVFNAWIAGENALRAKAQAFGLITLPSIGRKFTLIGGYLESFPAMPSAKKVLDAQDFGIRWTQILPAPV